MDNCEDTPATRGLWLDYMDCDLSPDLETPAIGTDWRALPPEVFVAALHGAHPKEQETLMLAAFGQVAFDFCCLFPDGPDNWPGTVHSWRSRMDSESHSDIPARALHFGGLVIVSSYLGRTGGNVVCSYVNRTLKPLARCEVSDA